MLLTAEYAEWVGPISTSLRFNKKKRPSRSMDIEPFLAEVKKEQLCSEELISLSRAVYALGFPGLTLGFR